MMHTGAAVNTIYADFVAQVHLGRSAGTTSSLPIMDLADDLQVENSFAYVGLYPRLAGWQQIGE